MSDEELKTILTELQKQSTKLYEEYGLTDEILELQIAINGLRSKFDMPDETQLTESNEGFVQ